jgi:hypothetical protein
MWQEMAVYISVPHEYHQEKIPLLVRNLSFNFKEISTYKLLMLNYDTKSWSKEMQEHNLAKSGYKPNIRTKKSLVIFLIFWLHIKNQI